MSLDLPAQETELEPPIPDTELAAPWSPAGPLEPNPGVAVKPRMEPVSAGERFFAVDALRGCALLGILAMNIVGFGWPFAAYENPLRGGGFEGLNRGIWFFNHMVFDAKMMTLFSMLFGAGLVLLDQRAETRGARIRGVYYRRILWLLVIGLIHAYLIWSGDILVFYAECGLLLYFFRNLRPKTLIILGVSATLILVPLILGIAAGLDYMKAATARVEAQIKAGEKPTKLDQQLHDTWTKHLRAEIMPTLEEQEKSWNKELAAYRGGYLGIVTHRAREVLMSQIFFFLFGGAFFGLSRMFLGMGLMKLGVFSAQRSPKFYAWMVGLGYGIGFPLMVLDALEMIRHRFSTDYELHGGVFYNLFGSLIVALGHVGLVMLIVQTGALTWLTQRLAAVGRMALTNYLTHSIVCTTLFYGYGFGRFGLIDRAGLVAIVLAIWVFQLLFSPIWLKYFRFGPAEWIWRSLTYWRIQPTRVESKPALGMAA
jgi:uncharacterized protein